MAINVDRDWVAVGWLITIGYRERLHVARSQRELGGFGKRLVKFSIDAGIPPATPIATQIARRNA